jgi:hypothetical protein
MNKELLKITCRNTSNRQIASYPLTYGVPLKEGELKGDERLAIQRGDGDLVPVQTHPLETYPDGSIKWLLLDFELPFEANEKTEVALLETDAQDLPAASGLDARETVDQIQVTTARFSVAINRKRFSVIHSWSDSGKELMAAGSDVVIEGFDGKHYRASLSKKIDVRLVEKGPHRMVVQASGRHTAEDGAELFDFRLRYTFRPHEPGVGMAYRFTNREKPETGVKVKSISILIPTALGIKTTKLARQSNHGKNWFSRLVRIPETVELIAGKAVNDAAKARYGTAAEGKVLIRNFDSLKEDLSDYPYYLRPGNARTDMTGGLRQMYPYLAMTDGQASAMAWFYDMELNYPKAIQAEDNRFTLDIWPASFGEFLVRRGQSKEQQFYVSLSASARSQAEMEGIYFDHEITGGGIWSSSARPVELTLNPDYVRDCRVLQLHRWLRYDEDRYFQIEVKLGSAGAKGSYSCRGMMDLGDYVSADRSWCHNNENDALLDMIREYYRRAEPTLLPTAIAKAYHTAHVDFIAYDPDPLRQGTMPAHCPEHTDGAAYPSHMWVDGLMAAYNVTGETDFLEAALSVGENMRRWQTQNSEIFYADSRECGWPMLAYLRLYEFTHDSRWLDASEEIFRFYQKRMGPDGTIRYELPHGVGTVLVGYGEFITWRAVFFFWEQTGRADVKEFLVRCLDKVYRYRPGHLVGGWASNDLFPAWAAYQLTANDKYIEDNYPFLQFLMQRHENFPWGGVDMHFYLAELDRRGTLERFA